MTWRFRKRLTLFPGLYLNLSKNGLSSMSIGRPGATLNIPINRDGGVRGTVGIPGTGLSYSEEFESRKPDLKGMPDPNTCTWAEWQEAWEKRENSK